LVSLSSFQYFLYALVRLFGCCSFQARAQRLVDSKRMSALEKLLQKVKDILGGFQVCDAHLAQHCPGLSLSAGPQLIATLYHSLALALRH
jgi:hypothetical protein